MSRSRWVKVKALSELMTSVVTRTLGCVLCERDDCIAIVTGAPRIGKVTKGDSKDMEPFVPVTPCASGENYPAIICESDIDEGGVYRLVLTSPKRGSKRES